MSGTRGNPSTDDHIERTETEARQAVTTGHMRYVLGISLTLAVMLMAAIYLVSL